MTTVVIDLKNKILAADRQCSFGANGSKGPVTKLWVEGDLAVACAGDLECGILMRDWIFATARGESVEPPQVEDTQLIVGEWRGSRFRGFTLSDKFVLIPLEQPFFAIGSGGAFAMGALASGCTALEALKIAHTLDPFTGKSVQYYDGVKLKRA